MESIFKLLLENGIRLESASAVQIAWAMAAYKIGSSIIGAITSLTAIWLVFRGVKTIMFKKEA